MFKFQESDHIAINSASPTLGLTAGDTGTVWGLYDTQPPAYEVTFQSTDGDEFSMVVNEDELTKPAAVVGTASQQKRAPAPA